MTDTETLKQEYLSAQETLSRVKGVFQELCNFLSEITLESEDTSLHDYNPFKVGYEEIVTFVEFNNTSVQVVLEYKDSYDDILDSSSKIIIPYDIVRKWFDGNKEAITEEVLKRSRITQEAFKFSQEERFLRKAKELGYEVVKKV